MASTFYRLATLKIAAMVALVSIATSCASNRRGPMSTSLTGLTSESRTYSGEVVDQTELVSIAGLLGTPAPGLMYHMIEKSELQSLVGISYDTKSFVLVGESAPSGRDFAKDVSDLKALIEEHELVQSKILNATRKVVELERKSLAIIELISSTSGTPKELASTETAKKPSAEGLQTLLDQVFQDTRHVKIFLANAEAHEANLSREIRSISSQPGIIIGKWRANEFGQVSMAALPFGSGSISGTDDVEGYVILGGVRVVVPFFSLDATTMLLDIEEASPGSLKEIKRAAVPTYLLQAKEVAYTCASRATKTASVSAKAKRSQLTSWASTLAEFQEVSLNAAYASSRENMSGGRIGKFVWRRVDINFSERWNLPCSSAHDARILRRKAQRDLLSLTDTAIAGVDGVSSEWTTVIAQVMTFGRLSRTLLSGYAAWKGYLDTQGDVNKLENDISGGRPPALIREVQPDCSWPPAR